MTDKEKDSFRLKNIEFRYHGKQPVIIRWYENSYYGQLEKYLVDGYERRGNMLYTDSHGIDISFFTTPESCLVIAWIQRDKEGVYLESVGSRLLDLTEDERQSFWEVYQKANDIVEASNGAEKE